MKASIVCGALILFYTSVDARIVFQETFETDPFESKKWTKSDNEKYLGQPVSYLNEPNPVDGFAGNKGLQLTQEMKHYGFGAKFEEALNVKGSDFVVQYEVKFLKTLDCGGAYVKLVREDINFSDLRDSTPYTIMFGPDRCGSNNKVHFILQHQNPVTKVWEEKHAKDVPAIKTDSLSHLYTLLVRTDNSFEIFIDSSKYDSTRPRYILIPAAA